MWGAYFCMGTYKHNVVVAMGAYIHGVLINPRRMRSEGYGTLSVCLCVCVCVCHSTSHF